MIESEFRLLKSILKDNQYNNIFHLLNGSKDPKDYPLVAKWSEECFNELCDYELIISAIDQELQTNGIKCMYDDNTNSPLVSYCLYNNDYTITIMYDHKNNKFFVGTAATLKEAINNKSIDEYLAD